MLRERLPYFWQGPSVRIDSTSTQDRRSPASSVRVVLVGPVPVPPAPDVPTPGRSASVPVPVVPVPAVPAPVLPAVVPVRSASRFATARALEPVPVIEGAADLDALVRVLPQLVFVLSVDFQHVVRVDAVTRGLRLGALLGGASGAGCASLRRIGRAGLAGLLRRPVLGARVGQDEVAVHEPRRVRLPF